jgi:acetyl-CoA acetyltransferase
VSVSGKYAIVGVGETAYVRGTDRTTRSLAVEATSKAIADAGIDRKLVDGILSYNTGDSTAGLIVGNDLGLKLNFQMDTFGGGSSGETLIGTAIGLMEARLCESVVIFRAMLGYSLHRQGGTGRVAAAPVAGPDLFIRPYGVTSPGERFAPVFMRYMHEHGTTSADAASVKALQSRHAASNPKALMSNPVTVDDVLSSRWIVKPLHLLDCCLETDNAAAIVVTSTENARNLRRPPVYILGTAGRLAKPRGDFYWEVGPTTRMPGREIRDRIFSAAGVTQEDIDITGGYDAFTFTVILNLEAYGFCPDGSAGEYFASGIAELDGRRPNNTSGGQLCEGYTHGLNLVIENVRQLRGQADDYCPQGAEGIHTYERGPGGCRQVRDPHVGMNMAWATPGMGSAVILSNR